MKRRTNKKEQSTGDEVYRKWNNPKFLRIHFAADFPDRGPSSSRLSCNRRQNVIQKCV